jgi:hypothetical protein
MLVGDLVQLVRELLAAAATLFAVGAHFAGGAFGNGLHRGVPHLFRAIVHCFEQGVGDAAVI